VFQEQGGSAQVFLPEYSLVQSMDRCFNSGVWFVPKITIKTSEKVLLIMDNCGPHSVPGCKGNGQIGIIKSPCEHYQCSVYQPMDMRVISIVKHRYRFELLS
jgi:hypothetical protein